MNVTCTSTVASSYTSTQSDPSLDLAPLILCSSNISTMMSGGCSGYHTRTLTVVVTSEAVSIVIIALSSDANVSWSKTRLSQSVTLTTDISLLLHVRL